MIITDIRLSYAFVLRTSHLSGIWGGGGGGVRCVDVFHWFLLSLKVKTSAPRPHPDPRPPPLRDSPYPKWYCQQYQIFKKIKRLQNKLLYCGVTMYPFLYKKKKKKKKLPFTFSLWSSDNTVVKYRLWSVIVAFNFAWFVLKLNICLV